MEHAKRGMIGTGERDGEGEEFRRSGMGRGKGKSGSLGKRGREERGRSPDSGSSLSPLSSKVGRKSGKRRKRWDRGREMKEKEEG